MTGYISLVLSAGKSADITLTYAEAYVQEEHVGQDHVALKKDRLDQKNGHLEGYQDNYHAAGLGTQDDPEIYEAMDSDFAGNSSVIPIGKKTDGSLKATSKAASTYDFSVMSDYVREKIKETGKKIFAGDISIHPYSLDGKSGCDYCPYHTVCGFDARMPGYSYHKLEKFDSADEVLKRMENEKQE